MDIVRTIVEAMVLTNQKGEFMSVWQVNEEAINALNNLSKLINDLEENIEQNFLSLQTTYQENASGLGSHSAQIGSLIECIKSLNEEANYPVKKLQIKLNKAATIRRNHIENNKYGKSKAVQSNTTAEQNVNKFPRNIPFVTKFFEGKKSTNNQKFELYDVDEHGFVHGKNYESFINDWDGYSSENFHTEMFGEHARVETIDSSSIEGIQVSEHDISDTGIFWGQHQNGGTKESFVEIASKIPKVKEALSKGKSIIELENDEELGTCTAIYFDPSNIPQVIQCDGYYEFQSNGRHRIIAARELGYDIPVKIIGTRKRK